MSLTTLAACRCSSRCMTASHQSPLMTEKAPSPVCCESRPNSTCLMPTCPLLTSSADLQNSHSMVLSVWHCEGTGVYSLLRQAG